VNRSALTGCPARASLFRACPLDGLSDDTVCGVMLGQVGRIIGRNGSHVADIRRQCRVHISVLRIADRKSSGPRVMTIEGTAHDIAEAMERVADFTLAAAEEAEKRNVVNPFGPGQTELRLLVDQSVVDAVLSTITDDSVHVTQQTLPDSTERSVHITGTPAVIGRTAERLVTRLFAHPVASQAKDAAAAHVPYLHGQTLPAVRRSRSSDRTAGTERGSSRNDRPRHNDRPHHNDYRGNHYGRDHGDEHHRRGSLDGRDDRDHGHSRGHHDHDHDRGRGDRNVRDIRDVRDLRDERWTPGGERRRDNWLSREGAGRDQQPADRYYQQPPPQTSYRGPDSSSSSRRGGGPGAIVAPADARGHDHWRREVVMPAPLAAAIVGARVLV